ncbi:class I SAM-dependent methyltransferase [Flavobacteriaceae bacterium TK19130]|nr:class I SAM-dependent methyltransferase [Thermobacterium salinum]
MDTTRRKFQGVLNILSFNRHFYVIGALLLAVLIVLHRIFPFSDTLFWLLIAAIGYGLIAPLLVSAYVYDFSGYYDLKWLEPIHLKESDPKHIVNINAGFDETSFLLQREFPTATLQVFDFYNPKRHTEPAIVRARNVSLVHPSTEQIMTDHIPLPDAGTEIVFILSALHEIRSNEEKVQFLKECRRICKPDGKVVLVEHLRDLPNFLAFSVGVTHFFSKKVWKQSFSEAEFSTIEETKFTPFMSIFVATP